MQPFQDISGLAVGLGGLFETFIPTGVSFVASQTWSQDGTPSTTLLVMGVSALLAVAWYLLVLGFKGAVWTPPQTLLDVAHKSENGDVEGCADTAEKDVQAA